MELLDLKKELESNPYPGRGIICGRSSDGKYAISAYFIMGRSENSRNRIFVATEDGIKTQAFDESKMEDPSLIIYSPVRVNKDTTIVTNGDQTDTIYNYLEIGKSFTEALVTRKYEPDAPNFTPRISAVMTVKHNQYSLRMSILKSDEGRQDQCLRYVYSYEDPVFGEGRFIHTYAKDGNPLPSFEGEPKRVALFSDDIKELADGIWDALNDDNKVSLYVRKIEIETGKWDCVIINKHK